MPQTTVTTGASAPRSTFVHDPGTDVGAVEHDAKTQGSSAQPWAVRDGFQAASTTSASLPAVTDSNGPAVTETPSALSRMGTACSRFAVACYRVLSQDWTLEQAIAEATDPSPKAMPSSPEPRS